ncbi:MAG: DUF5662 family protein [bacterium]|nr:DUF5662 family protein [bacterium]
MLLKQYTPQMRQFFESRTRLHIRRVHLALVTLEGFRGLEHAALHRRGFDHDASKFEPEEQDAYIWLTEHHRQRGQGNPYLYPSGIEPQVQEAILHHYSVNDHHPEFYAHPQEMPELALVEMVCDWTAMAQEVNRTNSARVWAEAHVGSTWDFSSSQSDLIFEAIGLLETRLGDRLPKL